MHGVIGVSARRNEGYLNRMASKPAVVHLDAKRVVGEISPFLRCGFAEHIGRCVYQGIYDPNSPLADSRGFRTDLLNTLREIMDGATRLVLTPLC
jgi:alpha-L-arabinofuranosidase